MKLFIRGCGAVACAEEQRLDLAWTEVVARVEVPASSALIVQLRDDGAQLRRELYPAGLHGGAERSVTLDPLLMVGH